VALRQEPHAVDGHDNNRASQEGNGALMQDNIDIVSVGAPSDPSHSESVAMADNGGGTVQHSSDGPAAPINGAIKHTSGYSRIRARHHALIEQHEQLKAEYSDLLTAYEAMEAALGETTSLLEQAPRNGIVQPTYPSSGVASLFARGVR
jgi:hypothetical protein